MIVFVTGLYKSGTSYITNMIEEMGYDSVVDRVATTKGVHREYDIRESYEVNRLNNDIIWSMNMDSIYFDVDVCVGVQIHNDLKQRIRDFLVKYKDKNIVIKDPRFIATIGFWLDEISDDYRVVYLDRTFEDTVKSFNVDKWFDDKIKGDRSVAVNHIQKELKKRMDYNPGYVIDYQFARDNAEKQYMLLYNYFDQHQKQWSHVKIWFADYYKKSKELTEDFSKQTPFNIGVWKNLVAVESQDEADYVIIQDKTSSLINNNSKVIFFGREPSYVYKHSYENAVMSFHHDLGNSWLPQTWWVDLPYNNLSDTNYSDFKTKNLSVIDSGKMVLQRHRDRVNLINQLEKKYQIDIYGKINDNILPSRDKKDGLIPYRYTLSIENGNTDYYFSEKIVDALICETLPLYNGCLDISRFFPDGSYYQIDINSSNIIDEIGEVTKNSDLYEKSISSIKNAKRLCLEKYNIWNTIYLAINYGMVL